MHLEANPEDGFRSERIRELVDALPAKERLAISLMYFGAGSPTLESVAADMKTSEYRVKGHLSRGKAKLREAMQADDSLGSLFPAED